MTPHMKAKLIFIGMKQKKLKNPKYKILSFSSSTNIQFTISEQFGFGIWVFHPNKNQLGFHMSYHLLLH
jgi:hypothetical protein